MTFAIWNVLPDASGNAMQQATQFGHSNNVGRHPGTSKKPASTKTEMNEDAEPHGDDDDDERGEMEWLTYKSVSTKVAKAMRKRPGAPKWTQKMCRLLEKWLKCDEDQEHTMEDRAQ